MKKPSLVVIATTACLLIPAASARAQPAVPPALDRLVDLNRKALRECEATNWTAAKKSLLEALLVGKRAKLESHGIMARTHLHLGLVWSAGYADHERAVGSFTRALEIDPTIRVQGATETPAIAAAFEEAQIQIGAAQAAARTAEPKVTPSVAAANPVTPLDYVEGREEGGKSVVSSGKSNSPNVVVVNEDADDGRNDKPGVAATGQVADTNADAVEENPLDKSTMRGGRAGIARRAADTRYGNRRFWIGLGAGTGAGYARGDSLETRPDLRPQYEPGFGWAGLGHLAPEVGYHITRDMAVSIQGRVQWIPQEERYKPNYATGAQSVLARLLFFGRQQRLRLFGAVMAGGGTGFRFTIHPDQDAPEIKDTVRGGPLLLGAGGGVSYELRRSISLVAEVNALAGIPVFSAVADLNLGVQYNIY